MIYIQSVQLQFHTCVDRDVSRHGFVVNSDLFCPSFLKISGKVY